MAALQRRTCACSSSHSEVSRPRRSSKKVPAPAAADTSPVCAADGAARTAQQADQSSEVCWCATRLPPAPAHARHSSRATAQQQGRVAGGRAGSRGAPPAARPARTAPPALHPASSRRPAAAPAGQVGDSRACVCSSGAPVMPTPAGRYDCRTGPVSSAPPARPARGPAPPAPRA